MTNLEKCRLVLRAAEDEIDRLKSELVTLAKENRRLKLGLEPMTPQPWKMFLEPDNPGVDLAKLEIKGRYIN